MEWADRGVVVGVRTHGETSVILEVLTREHGRHAGFVHGGRSRRMRPCLQAGNSLDLVWRSRLDEQLGSFAVEPGRLRGATVMASAAALQAVHHLCALVRLLAEREPHPGLHDSLTGLLDAIDDAPATARALALFELAMLRDLGFGLDLGRCAATGQTSELVYVSPKSGRAVSRVAGAPYHDRLLPLPAFLRDHATIPGADDCEAGLRLTAFFLERDVFQPRGLPLPEARAAYLRAVRDGAHSARAQTSLGGTGA